MARTLPLALVAAIAAQQPAGPAAELPGTRLLAGGGRLPPELRAHFLALAGGADARIVLIPTASQSADDPAENDQWLAEWREREPRAAFSILHTRDRKLANGEEFCAPLRAATGVWIGGGAQEKLAAAYVGTRVESELQAILARGGVVAGTSAGTAIQTRMMIQQGFEDPVVAQGFDFVPAAISDQHFLKRNRLPRLLKVLERNPGHFGIGVDEGTAALIRGRDLQVMGTSKVVLVLPAVAGRQQHLVELAAGEVADLVHWQRAARGRARPAPAGGQPSLRSGTLLLGGHGAAAQALAQVAALVGPAAEVLVLPGEAPDRGRLVAQLAAHGLTGRYSLDAASDLDTQRGPAGRVRAVWIDDLGPERLLEWFDDPRAQIALRTALAAGGVVAGCGGAAAVLGDYTGGATWPDPVRREAYERGLGLLPGAWVEPVTAAERPAEPRLGPGRRRPVGILLDGDALATVRGTTLEVKGDRQVGLVGAAPAAGIKWIAPGGRFELPGALRTGK